MPATNGSATPSVAATATAASIALPPWRRTSSPAEVASTSSEATAPPVPTATGCFVIRTALAVAAGVVASGLVAAQLSTIAPAADSATKPFRVDLIDFLPGAEREGVALFGLSDSGSSKHQTNITRTAGAACRGTGRASRSGVRPWAAGGSRGSPPGPALPERPALFAAPHVWALPGRRVSRGPAPAPDHCHGPAARRKPSPAPTPATPPAATASASGAPARAHLENELPLVGRQA